jgi:hypothetical protein
MKAFERKIKEFEEKKIVLEEKLGNCGRLIRPYNEMYQTAMQFLAQPAQI